jgi:hypothetical protein
MNNSKSTDADRNSSGRKPGQPRRSRSLLETGKSKANEQLLRRVGTEIAAIEAVRRGLRRGRPTGDRKVRRTFSQNKTIQPAPRVDLRVRPRGAELERESALALPRAGKPFA